MSANHVIHATCLNKQNLFIITKDTGGYNAPAARDVLCHDYYVTVKKDCEEGDPEQDRVKNAHFRVTLTEVAELPLRHVLEQNLDTAENAKTDELRRAMDVMLKTSAFSLMYGKSLFVT